MHMNMIDVLQCSKGFLTFVFASNVVSPFTRIFFAFEHGHLVKLLPVVRILHEGYVFANILLLRKTSLSHIYLLKVLHWPVWLRVLIVSIECTISHRFEDNKLKQKSDEGAKKRRHDRSLCREYMNNNIRQDT